MSRKNFLDVIKKQRKISKKKKFQGTFIDYLEEVSSNPKLIQLAHKRLYSSINDLGCAIIDVDDEKYRDSFTGDKIRMYDYFEKEFFGMEPVINKIMRYLKSAALKGEESRQVLLLMGPVGAGKSALVEHIKKALETTDRIYHLDGCPIREEPLHLIPRSLRSQFSEMLGINIEGDLCPICRHRLMNEFNGEYEKFPVTQSSFSQRARRGIASGIYTTGPVIGNAIAFATAANITLYFDNWRMISLVYGIVLIFIMFVWILFSKNENSTNIQPLPSSKTSYKELFKIY